MDDTISRQAALDAVNSLIDRFERILSDIRESKIDDSVCGMCEYDGAFVGQSGDWCNECPGFEKDNCFKLSDECRKRWFDSVALPSAQPVAKDINVPVKDCISRQAAIDVLRKLREEDIEDYGCEIPEGFNQDHLDRATFAIKQLPPIQPKRGRWISADAIFGGVPFYCSECGENTRDTVMGKPRWKFCPMCGAKMEGADDE